MKIVAPSKKNEKQFPHCLPQHLQIGLKEVLTPLDMKKNPMSLTHLINLP
jgi:hypothetical protein